MRSILILEDHVPQQQKLYQMALEIDHNLHIETTGSIREANEIIRTMDIDAFFVDIQLEDGNGLEWAKELRTITKYMFAPVVFTTSIPTAELEAFRKVHSYDYLIKPYTEERLREVMSEILNTYFSQYESPSATYLSIEVKAVKQRIYFDEILFIEYKARKISFVTVDGEIKYKHVSLKKLMEDLTEDFIQIHQSFVVNRKNIKEINTNTKMLAMHHTDVKLPIGKSYMGKIKEIM